MPRPLTHDLTISITNAFGVKLKNVFIYKFEDGIFSSELTLDDGNRQIIIDSRTSDAVALAIRTNAPIYTTRNIINETGFILESKGDNKFALEKNRPEDNIVTKLEDLPINELNKKLQYHIEQEEYEEAAIISKIIKNRNLTT